LPGGGKIVGFVTTMPVVETPKPAFPLSSPEQGANEERRTTIEPTHKVLITVFIFHLPVGIASPVSGVNRS
jgi:hypothetical protein